MFGCCNIATKGVVEFTAYLMFLALLFCSGAVQADADLDELLKPCGGVSWQSDDGASCVAVLQQLPISTDTANALLDYARTIDSNALAAKVAVLDRAVELVALSDGEQSVTHLGLAHSLGRFYLNKGLLDRAEQRFFSILPAVEAKFGKSGESVHKLWNDYAASLLGLNKFLAAQARYEAVIALRTELGDKISPVLQNALMGAGVAALQAGNAQDAVGHLQKHLDIVERLSAGGEGDAYTLTQLAKATFANKDYKAAESLWQRVVALEKDTAASVDVSTLLSLARLKVDLYEFEAALELLDSALRSALQKGRGEQAIEVATEIAGLKLLMLAADKNLPDSKLLAEAEQVVQQTLASYEAELLTSALPKLLEAKLTLAAIAGHNRAFKRQGNFLLEAAVIAYGKLEKNTLEFADALGKVASALYDFELYQQATDLFARQYAVYVHHYGEVHPSPQKTLIQLAKSSVGEKQQESRELFIQKALSTNPGKHIPISVLSNVSQLYADSGMPSLAIYFGKRAVTQLQSWRHDYGRYSATSEAAFRETVTPIYRHLAEQLIHAGRFVEAQQVLSMLKEQELHQFLQGSGNNDPRITSAVFTPKEDDWHQRFEKHTAALIEREPEFLVLSELGTERLSPAEAERLTTLKAASVEARQAYSAFLDELKAAFSAADQNGNRQSDTQLMPALAGERELLAPGVARVSYLLAADQLHILLTTQKQQLVKTVDVGDDFNKQVFEFLQTLKNPQKDPTSQSAAMYEVLLGPIKPLFEEESVQTLLVSQDGVLRYIPMAALYDGKRWLVQDYLLQNVVNAKANSGIETDSETRVAGFGVSTAGPHHTAIPAVERELDGIVKEEADDVSGVLPGVVYLNDSFTKKAFEKAIGDGYPVLHLASHFKLSPAGSKNSYLVLGNEETITADSFQRYKMEGVDLLTLSACETGIGDFSGQDGSEVEGLSALAHRQGVESVLASLWSVNDVATGVFMQAMYGLYSEGAVASALAAVQRAFISGDDAVLMSSVQQGKPTSRGSDELGGVLTNWRASQNAPYSHPYFWAPFVFSGSNY